MQDHKQIEDDFTIKKFFIPFTRVKAIHCIVIIGLLVYGNIFFNGFVWDDIIYIVNNIQVHSISVINSFGENYFNIAGQYRPLVDFYFSLLYSLFGTAPFYYHFLQLVLHILCAIVLYLFFCKFLDTKIAFICSILFLIHPIQVESVSFIAQTTSPLFFLFGIIPLFLVKKNPLDKKTLLLIYCLLLLSTFTKETGILFMLLLLIDAFLFAKKQLSKLIFVSFLSISTYLFFRVIVNHIYFTPRSLVPIAIISFSDRLKTMPAVLFYYLKTVFIPLIFTNDQQWTVTSLTSPGFYFPLIIDIIFFILLGIFGIYLYSKYKQLFTVYLFFVCWFLLGLCFLLQIFPLEMTVADRWFYFPFAGFIGILGILLQVHIQFWKRHAIVGVALCILLISLLSIRTIMRNTDWHDNLTLFSSAAKINDNYDIEENLGDYYFENKNYSQARYHYQLSVNFRPIEPNLIKLANAEVLLLDIYSAKKNYDLAFHAQSYPIYDSKMHALTDYATYGYILVLTDSPVKAEKLIHQAFLEYPNTPYLWYLKAIAEYKFGNMQQATNAAYNAYQLLPTDITKKLYYNIKKHATFYIFNTTLHHMYVIKPGN